MTPISEIKPLEKTDLKSPNIENVYRGKVREVYTVKSNKVIMIATDRISAFDHILPKGIPFKGQVLNKVATYFLDATADIVPNWLESVPHPNVAVGKKCEPIRLEMVIRGYLTGHAWRTYKKGDRVLCGAEMPEGMKENEAFPQPIITPATKAEEGHDEDISPEEILTRKIVSPEVYEKLEKYTRALFQRGTEVAAKQGLILVDTKYEFGVYNGEIILIDEIHTPDSSRYFYADSYQELLGANKPQRQLSKEFVREWLMEHGFQGLEGQKMPDMPNEFVKEVTDRYIELYEKVTGKTFERVIDHQIEKSIENALLKWL